MKPKLPILISLSVIIVVSILLYNSLFPEKSLLPKFNTKKTSVISLDVAAPVTANVPFKVEVNMDTLGQDVNAAGIYLHFDPNLLQVIDINTQSSFCQFYPEKKFDNYEGTVSLACGSPHPGFKGTNTLISLEFMPLAIGTTALRTDPKSQLLASDGKGTDMLKEYPSSTIQIANKL